MHTGLAHLEVSSSPALNTHRVDVTSALRLCRWQCLHPPVLSQDLPTGVDRQHESREARGLYPSALQLTCDPMLRFIGRAT
jgi:hypothetical protein